MVKGGSDDFFKRAAAHSLNPTIVNKDSNFVVITYWWGRGNLNKNTQRPCPEDLKEGEPLTQQPILYEKMIQNWEDACRKHGCNFLAEEYPEFAVKGGYQHAINFKPHFIQLALEASYPRGVLYIDGDMKVLSYPSVFDMHDIDYMARGWNTDSRPGIGRKKGLACFDPFVFEMSGGTMFFGNTKGGRDLLELWQKETSKHPGKADDRILSMAIMLHNALAPLNTIQLPIEYLWLDLSYGPEVPMVKGKDYEDIVISHPECLTGEDRATSEGAASNRYPRAYDRYVSDFLYCEWQTVFEYIHFETKKQVAPFRKYFDWMEGKGLVDVVPFSQRYGKKLNKIADANEELMNKMSLKVRNQVVIISKQDLESTSLHKIESERELFPLALKYLINGQHVVWVPMGTRSIKTVVGRAVDDELDFVTKNVNKDDFSKARPKYHLELDHDYPIYFSPKSRVLKHLLIISDSIEFMQRLFNSSYLFLTLIRCGWV
jgi:hypothetical protein